jgi:hypothetical protein
MPRPVAGSSRSGSANAGPTGRRSLRRPGCTHEYVQVSGPEIWIGFSTLAHRQFGKDFHTIYSYFSDPALLVDRAGLDTIVNWDEGRTLSQIIERLWRVFEDDPAHRQAASFDAAQLIESLKIEVKELPGSHDALAGPADLWDDQSGIPPTSLRATTRRPGAELHEVGRRKRRGLPRGRHAVGLRLGRWVRTSPGAVWPSQPGANELRLVAWPHYDRAPAGLSAKAAPLQPEGLIAPWDRTGSTTQ